MTVTVGHTTLRVRPAASAGAPGTRSRRQGAGCVPRLILRLERLQPEAAPPDSTEPAKPAPPSDSSTVPAPDVAPNGLAAGPVVDLSGAGPNADTTLGRWSAAVAAAQDGCLVVDPQGQVVSLSATAADLLDCSDAGVIGRRFEDVTELIDFESGETTAEYAHRIPPLAALTTGGTVRTLIRVRHRDDSVVTLDVCGMPLHDAAGRVVGSLSFLGLLPL
jgi:PAS domain-containing protein